VRACACGSPPAIQILHCLYTLNQRPNPQPTHKHMHINQVEDSIDSAADATKGAYRSSKVLRREGLTPTTNVGGWVGE